MVTVEERVAHIEGQVSEKFTLHINIGDGGTHKIGTVTSKVIEHQP